MTNLIHITETSHDIILSLQYATHDNVTSKPIYQQAECFLHNDALKCFEQAIEYAAKQHYRFKIFDAFRPIEAQQILWNHNPDETYVSHPETGSIPHCRGVAIDLTLVDRNNQELPMGTPFDDFTIQSHHGNMAITEEEQHNRYLLMGIMTTAGWDFFRNEWWHYQLFDARQYTRYHAHEAPINIMEP